MSKEERRVPEVRFEGFYDDWKQRKLRELTQRVTRRNKNLESTLPLTISAQDGLVDQNVYFNKVVASRDVSNYYLVKYGDFAYNKSYSNGYPLGAIKRLEKYEKGVLSTLYIVFKPIDVNSDFLAKYYDTTYWYHEVYKNAAEGVRNHGLLNISPSDFFETKLSIPKNWEEQGKIGTFIQKIDNTIALHQEKLSKLQTLKKVALQALFPKKDEIVPKVRFTNFNEAWKQRKLSSLANIVGGGTPNTKAEEYWDGDIDWYSPVEIGKDIYVYESQRKITELGLRKSSAKILPSDRTILFTSRAGIGDMAILKNSGTTNQGFRSMIVNDDTDTYFLYSYGNKIKKYALKHASGSTFLEISGKELSKIELKVPSLTEQRKIGFLFEQIDNVITLHQIKIKKLQTLKKGFLQKMFI
ncbi:restriction endonuclease subunit S [Tetragenococcus koreensis]|uniref:restriction endonuclease subunit S n=1 Tax=Tetragenococcus koreensis TaxID=290335 RepID=UPI001191B42C|nr:restriction endonuclease subunit S [Tetragenococcus koreensis]GEN91906.1 restriction endonuclease subunit S [Tetragenococcus koreensis]